MSTPQADSKNEREQPVSTSPSPRSPNRRGFTAIIASVVIVLLLILSASVIIMAQLRRQPITSTPTPNPTATTSPVPTSTIQPTPPPVGQWAPVLTGYHVTLLAAAPSHPNVLYVCASPAETATAGMTALRSADFGAHWQDDRVQKHLPEPGLCNERSHFLSLAPFNS